MKKKKRKIRSSRREENRKWMQKQLWKSTKSTQRVVLDIELCYKVRENM